MSFEILSEEPISMAQLKEKLQVLKKRDEELNFRAQKAEEYLNVFQKLDSKKSDELAKKLIALKIPRLKEQCIYKIVDLLPRTLDSLKAALQGYTLTVNNDNLKKIVAVVNEYPE